MFFVADLYATVAALFGASTALALRRRAANDVLRGVLSFCVLAALGFAPLLVGILLEPAHRAAAAHGLFVDPSVIVYVAPAVLATLLLVGAHLLFPGAARYQLAFVALVLFFITLNMANWCQPGWCFEYGWPMKYEWWSDVVAFGGDNPGAGHSSVALAVDVAIAVAPCALLVGRYRRVTRGA